MNSPARPSPVTARPSPATARPCQPIEQLESRRLLATFTVSTTADAGAGSLRNAVAQANANAGADAIVFSLAAGATINLTSGQLAISGPVSIAGDVTISTGGTSRHFDLAASAGAVSMSGLTLTGGDARQGSNVADQDGGAIRTALGSTLTLTDVTLANNIAADGGAIAAGGNLLVFGSHFTGNTARDPQLATSNSGGGAILSTGPSIELYDSRFTDNTTGGAVAGGTSLGIGTVQANGTLVARNTMFDNNTVLGGGTGGAIAAFGALNSITNSTFTGNRAVGVTTAGFGADGGAIYHESGLMSPGRNEPVGGGMAAKRDLAEPTPRSGVSRGVSRDSSRGTANSATLDITGSTFTGNTATRLGGAVATFFADVDLATSRFAGNGVSGTFASGGGLFVDGVALHVMNVEISGNTAVGNAAGASFGGGFYTQQLRDFRLLNTTVTGNTADYGGGGFVGIFGRFGAMASANSTITANTGTVDGGGLFLQATVENAQGAGLDTVFGNTILAANIDGGGQIFTPDLFVLDNQTATPSATVDVDFTRANFLGTELGSLVSTGSSIVDDNPMLAPLGFYGGLTQTRPPIGPSSPVYNEGAGSWAVDPGLDLRFATADDVPLTVDQRAGDYRRVVYGAVDMGAAEYTLPGDANRDGEVDLSDFVILRNNFGTGSVFSQGDFDGDGDVDLGDFVILRNHFGESVPVA